LRSRVTIGFSIHNASYSNWLGSTDIGLHHAALR
jgi:hypothetical protein